jgi:hypothetical protein
MREQQRRAWALAAVAAAGLAAAAVLAEDVPQDTGSTAEASDVQTSATDTSGSSNSSGPVGHSWRSGGYGETAGQMATMLIAVTCTSVFVLIWICCHVFKVGAEAPDPDAEVPALTAAVMAVVDSNRPRDEKKEEVEKLVRRAIECGMHSGAP